MSHYAVIGLGKFGFNIAKGLADQGEMVMAIDNCDDRIREVNEFVSDAINLDSTDIKALKEAGVAECDVAIVSIGEHIESSILTVMALKEIGVETVIAKAITVVHGQILTKIGASKVIYPEMESAKKLVKNLVEHMHYEMIDLSNTMKIVKIMVPDTLIGKTMNQIHFEEDYDVTLIAYKHEGHWHRVFDRNDVLSKNDILVVLGNINQIEKLSKAL
jgi:trk system potassium uptake protein TrkA